jgi:hypothetical protein
MSMNPADLDVVVAEVVLARPAVLNFRSAW